MRRLTSNRTGSTSTVAGNKSGSSAVVRVKERDAWFKAVSLHIFATGCYFRKAAVKQGRRRQTMNAPFAGRLDCTDGLPEGAFGDDNDDTLAWRDDLARFGES